MKPRDVGDVLEGPFFLSQGYQVASWSPGRADENIPVTQVHIAVAIPIGTLVIRIKSRGECERLIAMIEEHMEYVWPETAVAIDWLRGKNEP